MHRVQQGTRRRIKTRRPPARLRWRSIAGAAAAGLVAVALVVTGAPQTPMAAAAVGEQPALWDLPTSRVDLHAGLAIVPLANVANCAGSDCATVTMTSVVVGGGPAATTSWNRRAQNSANATWYDFTSGQVRTVVKPATYVMSAISTNPAVTADYATAVTCVPGNNQVTVVGATVTFPSSGNASNRSVACTFTHTYITATLATINVQIGSDRSGLAGVTTLAGVRLQLYDGPATGPTTPVTDAWGTCDSGPAGVCSFTVPWTGLGQVNENRRFWIRQVGAPAGYYTNPQLRTGDGDGSGSQATDYSFRTGDLLQAGVTYSSQNASDFMLGSGTRDRTASGGIWQQSRINPTLPASCGIDVAILLDLSGSVGSAVTDLRQAADTFVNSLVGTPSRAALFSFSTVSPAARASQNYPDLTPVSTVGQAAAFKSRYATWTASGGTNWDRGLAAISEASATYDIAIVITDGSPSYYNDPAQGPGSFTRLRDVEAGIFSANAIKAQNTRVIAFGVGAGAAGLTSLNLRSISGPTINSDYFQTTDYAQAGAALRALALGSCGSTLTVVKQIVPPSGTTADATPGVGWTFTPTTSTPGVVLPGAGITDSTGAVNFPITFPGGTTTAPITVAETQQTGYTVVQQGGFNASCTNLQTGAAVGVTNAGATGFTVNGSSTDPISCIVYNRAPLAPAAISVSKTWVINGVTYPNGAQPAEFQAQLRMTGPGGAGETDQGWDVPRGGFSVGNATTLSEVVTTPDPSLCTAQSQLVTVNGSTAPPLPQPLPATVSLTQSTNTAVIRNTVTCQSRLTLEKEVRGGNVPASAWTLEAVGANGQTLAGATGTAPVTDVSVAANVRYQLRETGGDPRYLQDDNRTNLQANPLATGSATCIRIDDQGNQIVGFSDGINGGVDVPIGQRVQCTLTNRTAALILLKHVVNDHGGGAAASDWTLSATPAGDPIAGLDPVTGIAGNENPVPENTLFVRPDHPYAIFETGGRPGYAMAVECITDTDPIISWTRLPSNIITAPVGFTTTCRVVNDDIPATLTLVKEVTTTGQPGAPASPYNWTLTAAPTVTSIPTTISGRGQIGQDDPTRNPQITARQVWSGVYQLSEASDGSARTAGYVQQDPWSCTSEAGIVTLANGLLNVEQGLHYTCTVRNAFQVGSLAITKAVTGPAGSISNPQSLPFTAQYTCTFNGQAVGPTQVTVNPGALGSPGAPVIVSDLPANGLCTVVEVNPPTGSAGLADTSYSWLAPVVGPPATVAIPVGGTVTVNVTNPIQQQFGSLRITKTIAARAGTPQGGYTGGPTRTFPMAYTCTIGATTTASGTVNVSTGAGATVTGIPATSVCAVAETQALQAGDFLDASFQWDGYTTTPASAAIASGGTASIEVTNFFLRNYASLVIDKVVTGSGYAGTAADFTVTWDCGAPYQGSQAIAAGASTTTIQVPAGVACTVGETTPSATLLAAGFVWLDPEFDGLDASGEVVIPVNQTATVTVTNANQLAYSRIAVTKTIDQFGSAVLPGTTFTVNVSCDAPAQGGAADYSEDFTLTWPGTLSAVSDYLPIAASCTVDETSLPSGSTGLTDASYAWGPAPAAQDVTVPDSTTPASVTVTNTIVRVSAPFGIVKSIVNPFPVTADGPFSGTFSCQYAGDAPIIGTWTRSGAGAATLTPAGAAPAATVQVLVGSSCSALESAADGPVPGDPSYTWSIQQPGPVTVVGSGATATVTNTVNRSTGSFTLTKSVSGGDPDVAYAADAEFVFDYTCTTAGGETLSGQLTVQVGVSAGVADIPGGSTCDVTESEAGLPQPIDPYRWDDVGFAQAGAASTSTSDRTITFTTTADAVIVNVAATNTISPKTATVIVAKTVSDPDGGFTGGADAIFPITLTCAALTRAAQNVGDGGSVRFEGIPLGSTCTATEGAPSPLSLADGSFAWGIPAIDAPVRLDVADQEYTIDITNPVVRVAAPIEIAKVFDDGGYPGVVDPGWVYSGTWSCTYSGAGPTAVVDGTWSGPGSSTGDVATISGGADSILVGSVCTVTETAPAPPSAEDPSYRWTGPVLQGVTVAPVPAVNRLQVTNTLVRDTGDLRVAKEITGETSGYIGDDDPTFAGFPVSVICYLDTPGDDVVMEAIVEVTPGQDLPLLSGVPAGWTCDVAETPVSGQLFDDSYRWSDPVIRVDGTEGTRAEVVAGETTLVDVENPIERVLGGVEILKVLDANIPPGVVVDPSFQGAYTCVYAAGTAREETFGGTWAVDGLFAGSASANLIGDTEFPVGTSCSVTEEPPAGGLADPSWAWGAPTISDPVPVTETPTAVLTVTNGVTRVWAGLSITKVYAGIDGAIADPGLEVSGSWSCTYDGTAVPGGSGIWTLPATGGTTTVISVADGILPATSSCSVTEATLDDADLIDGSYAWDAAEFAPDGGAVTLPADGIGTVTVTNSTVRVLGAFQVTKALELGDGVLPDQIDPTLRFGGTYSCQYGTDAPATGQWGPTTVGGVWQSPPQFFVGSVCSVTETDRPTQPVPGDESHVWGDPTTATVTVAGPAASPAFATITNPVERVTGTIRIAKDYAPGTPPGVIRPDTSFTGTYTCVFGEGVQTWQGTWSVTGAGQAALTPTGLDLTTDFPLGTACEVTEDALDPGDLIDPSWAWAAPTVDPEQITVTDPDAPAAVTVTNGVERVNGGFSVTKVIEGTADVDLTYEGDFRCVYTPTDPQVPAVTVDGTWGPIAAGATWTSAADAGIPLGSSCAVTTETRAENPVADDLSYRWIEPFDPGSPVIAAVDATAPLVTVTNQVVRVTGAFGVAKSVAGDTEGIASDARFDFTWSCTAGDGGIFPDPAPGAFSLADGEVWNLPASDAVPAGSVCTVTEGTPPAPVHPSYAWSTALSVSGATGTPDASSITFTLPADPDAVVLVSAVNTLTRAMGTYTVSKTSDPEDGASLMPGEPITYTVTVTPGAAGFVDDVVLTDDLAAVLTHATLDESSIVASVGAAALSGTDLVWTIGRVEPGKTFTLTYTVAVHDDAFGVRVRNLVSAAGEIPPAACEPCSTTHVTPRWALSKSSDPASGSTVLPGQTIVYTLAAENISEALVDRATATDDLSGILPYADLVQPLDPALSLAGTAMTWNIPALAPGQIATVSYSVTLTDASIGATLQNVAAPDQPTGECAIDMPERIVAAAAAPIDPACSTAHPVPQWTLEKTSNPPSGWPIGPGSDVTYTLTAVNTSAAVVTGALAHDDLSQALTRSTIVEPLAAGLSLSGTQLTWTIPQLDPGASASVTYTLHVFADAAAGALPNSVAPFGAGGDCLACETAHTIMPGLPPTGAVLPLGIAIGGVLALIGGTVLWMIGRRRREREDART